MNCMLVVVLSITLIAVGVTQLFLHITKRLRPNSLHCCPFDNCACHPPVSRSCYACFRYWSSSAGYESWFARAEADLSAEWSESGRAFEHDASWDVFVAAKYAQFLTSLSTIKGKA